jgi:hypothetical protein
MPVDPVDHMFVAVAVDLRLGLHWAINGLPKSHCFSIKLTLKNPASCIGVLQVISKNMSDLYFAIFVSP